MTSTAASATSFATIPYDVPTMLAAIAARISCRAYDDREVEREKLDALREAVAFANEAGGLSFQLHDLRREQGSLGLRPQMFANPENVGCYLALVAGEDEASREAVGYYGEYLVLLATSLGLGTCWIGGTFDRSTTPVRLGDGEILHDVVPLGYAAAKTPLKQRTIRTAIRARDKRPSALYEGPTPLAQAPTWIRACVDAVIKGPSAVNEQPVVFKMGADGVVRATLPKVRSGIEFTDLGIAKFHFEVAAAGQGVVGRWERGAGGAFVVEGA